MATPKTITLHDVTMDTLRLARGLSNEIHVRRRYFFVDDVGERIPHFPRVLEKIVQWVNIPANIQQALISIDTWCENQIQAQDPTIYQIVMQAMRLARHPVDGRLYLHRRYYLSEGGQRLPGPAGKLSVAVDWIDVPQNIKSALVDINAWCYGQILADEGME
jgi:hypothetical protein